MPRTRWDVVDGWGDRSPSVRSVWTEEPFHNTACDRAGRYDAARAADAAKKPPAPVVCDACGQEVRAQ